MMEQTPAGARTHGWTRLGRWSARAFATVHTLLVLVMLWSPPPPPPEIPIPWLDKAVHAALFAVFALAWSLAGMRPRTIAIVGTSLGVLTELVQGVLPWPRTPDVFDVVADVAGLAIVLALAALVASARRAIGRRSWRNGRDSNPR